MYEEKNSNGSKVVFVLDSLASDNDSCQRAGYIREKSVSSA